MTEVVLGIDLGTSGVKITLLDRAGRQHGRAVVPLATSRPRPGWLEQEPDDWWAGTVQAIKACLDGASDIHVASIGLSGHMSGLVLATRDRKAARPCLLLADDRGGVEVDALPANLLADLRGRTGNVPSEVFTIGKLLWVREHEPETYERVDHILFPKDFIRMRLTDEVATEPTDAGNSLLLNEDLTDWDDDLLARVGLRRKIFPRIARPAEVVGKLSRSAAEATGLTSGTPVVAGASDMACSALGCGAVSQDIIAVTIGTAAPVVRPVPGIRQDVTGILTFHPHAITGGIYAMGSILSGGLALSWSASLLAPDHTLDELVTAAGTAPAGSGGALFVPTLVGAGTPWWEPNARGAWLGLSPGATRETLLRSVLEGVAFNIRESVDVFEGTWGPAQEIRLAGGGSRSGLWAEITAGVLGRPVHRLRNPDASAVGAAALAAVGVKWFDTPTEAANTMARVKGALVPKPADIATYQLLYPLYRTAFSALRNVDDGLAGLPR